MRIFSMTMLSIAGGSLTAKETSLGKVAITNKNRMK
jgi:hypothetical protein